MVSIDDVRISLASKRKGLVDKNFKASKDKYDELLQWYFDVNKNLLNVSRMKKIHSHHLIKDEVDNNVFNILSTSYNYPKNDIMDKLSKFVDELKEQTNSECIRLLNENYYYYPRIKPLDEEKEKLIEYYLPIVKHEKYNGEIEDTRYPQNEDDLQTLLSKVEDEEFIVVGKIEIGEDDEPLNWKNVKRLHLGCLEDLRELPEDSPITTVIYSPYYYDDGSCSLDIKKLKPKQWLWENPVKLVMFYDVDDELTELLLPRIENDFLDDFKTCYNKNYYLDKEDVYNGDVDVLINEMNKSHGFPKMLTSDEYDERRKNEDEYVSSEVTNKINIPDDKRIESVDVILYCNEYEPTSKIVQLCYVKLLNVMDFGRKDKSTDKFTLN